VIAPIRVALIGDFDRGKPSHWAAEAALFHAAAALGARPHPIVQGLLRACAASAGSLIR
jgi:hypothetical protein